MDSIYIPAGTAYSRLDHTSGLTTFGRTVDHVETDAEPYNESYVYEIQDATYYVSRKDVEVVEYGTEGE